MLIAQKESIRVGMAIKPIMDRTDPQTQIDWGIPELTGDVDGDEEYLNYELGDGAGMG